MYFQVLRSQVVSFLFFVFFFDVLLTDVFSAIHKRNIITPKNDS